MDLYSTLLTRYPVAEDVAWEVDEDTGVGTSLGFVSATDPDGDQLSFAIAGGDGAVAIDDETGEVTLTAPLDYESQTQHVANVAIDDGPSPPP